MYREASEELLSFIKKSPSCFHAVATISEQLKAEGVTVIEIDKEACQEACMTTWDKYAAEVENGQDIIDAILAVE